MLIISPLPKYEGNLIVHGLQSEVQIYRDEYGISYIKAVSHTDAAFGLGFVHAQERLFQMDLARRAGQGRLSEVFGNNTSVFDKMFKTLGIYQHVVENYNNLNSVSKELLEAYSKGVNEYMKTVEGNYSIEFDVLDYDPYEWKPQHSLVIAKLLAWELNVSWWTDLAFTHLVQKLGKSKAEEILPNYDENNPTIIPEEINNFSSIDLGLIETDQSFRNFMGFASNHSGSNNWVINGSIARNGKPIIANDPHLTFSIPGKWYLAVIRSDNWNADGFSIPGLPAIVIGKNFDISWAVTNVMTDDTDFYIEKLDSSNKKYYYNKNWNDIKIKRDTIFVKDSLNIIFDIKNTHRGPIISNIHPYNILYKDTLQESADISMRWTALEFSDELFAIISVNRARNWDEFESALEHFTVPGQNFVYGDINGNIGYVCATKLPIRTENSPTLVYDGTTDQYDWIGFVPYNLMPKLYNPASNFIASANNKTDKSFPYYISNNWDPSSRIMRILELLSAKENHSIKDFKLYQKDIYSYYAKWITPFILEAFKETVIKEKNLKTSLELLKKWDYEINKYSQTPSIFLVFLQKIIENIFLDEMGKNLLNKYIFVPNIPYRILQQLLKENDTSWFDNVNTPEVETKNFIIRKSMIDALLELEEKFGNDLADWQWLNLHKLNFKHPFSGVNSIIDKFVDLGPYSLHGDGTTIFKTAYIFSEPYNVKLGPSMRYIFDFSKPNEFYVSIPTGQSGHVMSKHYSDLTKQWINDEYIKIKTNENYFINANFKLLTLK
ncbi:penicillin acylase family protein [Bacteroidota bacterium]